MSTPFWIDPAELLFPHHESRLLACEPPLDRAGFNHRVLSLASALQARGVRHVALWFDDAVELAIALYACWRVEIVAHIPGDILPQTCSRLDSHVDVWLSDTTLPLAAARVLTPATLTAQPLPAVVLSENTDGVILYTSGSSGTPKPVTKQWRQLANEVRALAHRWPAHESQCVLGSVGAHHMFGLPFRVLWPLCAGHVLDRPQRHYPEELQNASLKHTRFFWVTSPALLRRIEQRVDWAALRGRLAAIYTAGGPLPPAISDEIATASGCPPTEIYGSSETGIIGTRQGDQPWQLLREVQAGLNDRGALWVSSLWTTGVEQTADAATLTAAGLQLHGRMDRVVKLEEKRISLREVEHALESHPYVAESRVGLRPDLPRLSAALALTDAGLHALRNGGRQALIDALRGHLHGRVPPLAVPRSWRLFRCLPWNAQGKLTHAQFLDMTAARARHPQFEAPRPIEDGALQMAFDVPLDLPVFSGHFPGTPVVPGVTQIEWAFAQANRHLRPGLRSSVMENLKFQRLMRPGDHATLTLRWDDLRNKVLFSYHIAGKPCSSGRIACLVDESRSV